MIDQSQNLFKNKMNLNLQEKDRNSYPFENINISKNSFKNLYFGNLKNSKFLINSNVG